MINTPTPEAEYGGECGVVFEFPVEGDEARGVEVVRFWVGSWIVEDCPGL